MSKIRNVGMLIALLAALGVTSVLADGVPMGERFTANLHEVVIGNVEIDGVKSYRGVDRVGQLIVFTELAPVYAQWGARRIPYGNDPFIIEKLISEELKDGCNGGCLEVEVFYWPRDKQLLQHRQVRDIPNSMNWVDIPADTTCEADILLLGGRVVRGNWPQTRQVTYFRIATKGVFQWGGRCAGGDVRALWCSSGTLCEVRNEYP